MKFLLVLLFSFITLLYSTNAFAGVRPALPKPYFVAPFILDNKVVAEAWVFPRDDRKQFVVESKPLLQTLENILKEPQYKELERRVQPENVLSLYDLEAVGISVRFDEKTLELKLDVPLSQRRTNELDLNYAEGANQKYLRPSAHSGYINLRLLQAYQYGADVPAEEKMPLTAHVDLVENIRGFTFETMAEYLESDEYPWQRQDTRLRFDNEDKMLRFTLGDLTLLGRGFQQSPNLGGASLVRDFSIQPYKTLRPLSNSEIVIKRPSLVEIFVNGFLYSQLRLAPGVFNIRDYPLAVGQNSVKVKITDDLGQVEIFDFSILFENTLLGKGVHEFSYAAGFPWEVSGADRAYDNTAAMTTFYHRVGLTNEVTFGFNYQNYLSQAMTGLELSGISTLGYMSLEGSYATNEAQQEASAQRFRYRSIERMFGKDIPVTLALETENRDSAFLPVSPAPITSSFLRRYDGQLNYRSPAQWVWGIGTGVNEVTTGENLRSYRTNVLFTLNPQTRMEFSLNRTVAETEEDRGLISFYWTERQGRLSASAYYDSSQRNSTVSVSRNNIYKYDDYRLNASVHNQDNETTGSLSGEYLSQAFSLRLDHYSQANLNTTGLGLNTGLAWVGNSAAFTQPIYDSFVLLRTNSLPPGRSIVINPSGEKGEAQLGPGTSVVLRDQSAYYKHFLSVDTTSLPMGYLLDREYFGTQPTYRSGIALDLVFKKRILVKGRLVDAKGEGLQFIAGDIVNSQGQLVDNSFFTNKNGGFVIEGLEPGSYTLTTSEPNLESVQFKVEEVSSNQLNLGTITVGKEN
ncbi:fimbria/pilus outer membrane usher protein [Bdellovibrio reynosensis]|uniref:Fimbria/pilus outer membrane usher protein n=1 Tax=Bdellovibrio reynosensis TaxID=2835041 RepID=A0ABY4C606_9BACT|nr:fimbria/pilus outer membrane usher protein [Bdellovibrio reynosensis]UOF00229.1 fimbria/pilus outer membrane usher protein [Bdellovibrio reynosensis]